MRKIWDNKMIIWTQNEIVDVRIPLFFTQKHSHELSNIFIADSYGENTERLNKITTFQDVYMFKL